jgi:transposase
MCLVNYSKVKDELRQEMLKRGYVPIIGYRKNRKERVKTEEIYHYFGVAQKRWVVERTFSGLKRKSRKLLI